MRTTTRRQEVLAGINVVDHELYARYRTAMMPILREHGGFFRDDFRIAEVLQSEVAHAINRLFVISFPSPAARDAFFGNEEYLDVRREFFDPSVEGATILSTYAAQTEPP